MIKSGVTLRGQGFSTHIYLDPTTPPNPLRYFPLRIGTGKVPASNVVIEQLRYTGHDKAIGGGSIMGLNARLDEPESLLLSCDNVSIRHCWIYDAKQAAGCTKPGGSMYEAKTVITPAEATAASKAGAGPRNYTNPDRLASQFKNWQVCHNFIDTCGNKAVELAECNGGLIADNYMTNVVDGPQVIFGSRNVQIRDNEVYFTRHGHQHHRRLESHPGERQSCGASPHSHQKRGQRLSALPHRAPAARLHDLSRGGDGKCLSRSDDPAEGHGEVHHAAGIARLHL